MPTVGWTVTLDDMPYHISVDYSPLSSPRAKLRINGIQQQIMGATDKLYFIIGAHQGRVELHTGFMSSFLGADLYLDEQPIAGRAVDKDEIPPWAWAFVAALIPLFCCFYGGGLLALLAIPVAAFGTVLTSRRHDMPENSRIMLSVAFIVGAYVVSLVSGVFFLLIL